MCPGQVDPVCTSTCNYLNVFLALQSTSPKVVCILPIMVFALTQIQLFILNCTRDCFSLTYLGVPFSGRRPRWQDWLNLFLKVSSKLTSLKANYLSPASRLTLINSVISSIPTYGMIEFKLPVWVANEIDKIHRDFLWKRPELGAKGIRLIA